MESRKIKVLVVDDEQIVRDFFKRLLGFLGVEVSDVDNGNAAIDLVRQTKFDLCFIDVRMPGLNGLDTYREIHKLNPDAMAVMITGYAVEEILEQAQKEGAYGHIHKPFDISEIKNVITKASEEKAGAPIKALVVDDEKIILNFFANLLKSKNIQYWLAASGAEAIELAKKEKFDLVFLDLVLRDTNGAKLSQEIKEICPGADIVLITGYPQKIAELKGQVDISGCLYKPFDMNDIVKYIEMVKAKING
jgi:two-component system, NtrC family, response regulator HydG